MTIYEHFFRSLHPPKIATYSQYDKHKRREADIRRGCVCSGLNAPKLTYRLGLQRKVVVTER